MKLHPAVARGRRLVRNALSEVPAGSRVLIAVSGGADSLALAAVTAFECRSAGWSLHAMIVDHGLQPGSADVASRAQRQLTCLGVEGQIVPVRVGDSGGTEAAARAARYDALDRDSADVIVLAHTLDDQAETVLMGLGRGSGPRSIAGMRPVDGRYRRPFLELRRAETEQICKEHDIAWWSDPHNDDSQFRRVRVRHELLPLLNDVLGGGVAEALARTAAQLRTDVDYLDAVAAEHHDVHHDLTASALAALPSAIRLRVLRLAALQAGASRDELNSGHICGIDALVTGWRGQRRIELPGHVSASRQGDQIVFVPTPMAC